MNIYTISLLSYYTHRKKSKTSPYFYIIRDQPFKSFGGSLFLWNILFSCQMENKYRINGYFLGSKIWRKYLEMGCIYLRHKISQWLFMWYYLNAFFAHLTSSRRKRKLNSHQNNHLYGKIRFFFWISTLISVTAENWSYTSYLFFTPVRQIISIIIFLKIKSVTWNEQEFSPLS